MNLQSSLLFYSNIAKGRLASESPSPKVPLFSPSEQLGFALQRMQITKSSTHLDELDSTSRSGSLSVRRSLGTLFSPLLQQDVVEILEPRKGSAGPEDEDTNRTPLWWQGAEKVVGFVRIRKRAVERNSNITRFVEQQEAIFFKRTTFVPGFCMVVGRGQVPTFVEEIPPFDLDEMPDVSTSQESSFPRASAEEIARRRRENGVMKPLPISTN